MSLVLRVYDRTLGFAVAQRFGFDNVRSTVALAAPWFIGAAMGLQVLGTFSVGQSSFMIGAMHVEAGSELDGLHDVRSCPPRPASSRSLARTHQSGCSHAVMPGFRAGDTAYLVGPYRELLATLRKGQRPQQSTVQSGSFERLRKLQPAALRRGDLVFRSRNSWVSRSMPTWSDWSCSASSACLAAIRSASRASWRSTAASSFSAARRCAPDIACGSAGAVRGRPCGARGIVGRQPQVLVDAAGQVPQPAVEDRVLLVGDALEEVPVVRDDDQGARPGVEQVLDGGEHVGVDVVGRLVEQQHVGLGEQDEHQLQPALLPAGEVADRRGELRGRNPSRSSSCAGVTSRPSTW